MEHWEFLLQKEGDRSWLPLDSPDVEILEGRYRIVARSSNSNAAIETRIAHLATEEVPPKRRVQKRLCHTNQDGLMVVIPFTRLEPGLWELQCSPTDLLTDLMAGAQPHAVTLQVVARESEEDWEPDWTAPADDLMAAALDSTSETVADSVEAKHVLIEATPTGQASIAATDSLPSPAAEILPSPVTTDRQISLPPEVAEMLGASMDRLFQIAEQMSEQLVDEVLHDFDLNAIADEPVSVGTIESDNDIAAPATDTVLPQKSDEPDAVTLLPGYTLAADETFALTLDQAALVAGRDEVLTLSGRVAIVAATSIPSSKAPSTAPIAGALPQEGRSDPWDDAALTLAGATAQSLQLCLRDPQSLQILVSDRQPLASDSLPASFTFSFSLPDAFATHLVLGEVLLCGSLPGQPEASIALTTQAFSITVDPNLLVGELAKLHEALTTEIDDEERIDLPLELSSRLKQASPALDLSFLDLAVVEPLDERSPCFPSLAGQPLPPQLYRPDPEQANSKPLALPAFKLNSHPNGSASLQTESATPEASDASAPIAAEAEMNAANSPAAAPASPDNLAEVVPLEALDAATRDAASGAVPSEVVTVALDRASTDSTNKTLDLPSPMHMAFQSLKLQDRFLTRLTSLATDTELSALLKANLAPGSMQPSAMTTPSMADARSLAEEIVVDDEPQPSGHRSRPKATVAPLPDEPPNPLVLPADDPVPMPTLEVTAGELISGKPINIRIKLPNLLPRIYVKLWITDRQTRSLLDGPRWLVDFLPNGLGDLEAMTPLTVPFGSIEIRLEAIAVEMHTQRESHKVTVDRIVIPPNLPIVSLDDFNE